MKKLLLFSLTFIAINFVTAQMSVPELLPAPQDTLYIYHNNQIVFKRAVNSIDSITFKHNYPVVNTGGTVLDVDGNINDYITINGVDWFVNNLKTTKLNDGTDITNVTNLENVTNASYAVSGSSTYYNFYAANLQNICPAGWNVPFTQDFNNLNNFVYNETELWVSYTNQMGLNFPAEGYYTSLSLLKGTYAGYWTQEEASSTNGKHAYIYQGPLQVSGSGTTKRNGLSIKCVRNGHVPSGKDGDGGDGIIIKK